MYGQEDGEKEQKVTKRKMEKEHFSPSTSEVQ